MNMEGQDKQNVITKDFLLEFGRAMYKLYEERYKHNYGFLDVLEDEVDNWVTSETKEV
jgi:hypothetical protein